MNIISCPFLFFFLFFLDPFCDICGFETISSFFWVLIVKKLSSKKNTLFVFYFLKPRLLPVKILLKGFQSWSLNVRVAASFDGIQSCSSFFFIFFDLFLALSLLICFLR